MAAEAMAMTTLPAVSVDAQAYEVACTWFREWRDHRNDDAPFAWLRTSPLMAEAGGHLAHYLLRQGALLDPFTRLKLIAAARDGNVDAQQALSSIIIECHGRGIELSPDLITYEMEVHAGLVRPYSQPGPRRKDKMLRNQIVALGVELLIDRFGLLPTYKEAKSRGRPSGRRPASAIVAAAYTAVMAHQGGLSAKRVEEFADAAKAQRAMARDGWL